MTKECKNCKKEYEFKRAASLFCSDVCRTTYNRKHPKPTEMVSKFQMQTLYNEFKAAIQGLGKIGGVIDQPLKRNEPTHLEQANEPLNKFLDEPKSKLDAFWQDLNDADTKEWCLSLAGRVQGLTGLDWLEKKRFITAANQKSIKLS